MSDTPERKLGPGPGRPPGALNKISRDLKTAMLDAAVLSDRAKDPEHPELPGTLVQYMLNVEQEFPQLFFQALTRIIPKEVRQHLHQDTQIDITFNSVADVERAMLDAGMSRQQIAAIEKILPAPLEPDEG